MYDRSVCMHGFRLVLLLDFKESLTVVWLKLMVTTQLITLCLSKLYQFLCVTLSTI